MRWDFVACPQMRMVVLVRAELRGALTEVKGKDAATGLGNVVGNKVRIRVMDCPPELTSDRLGGSTRCCWIPDKLATANDLLRDIACMMNNATLVPAGGSSASFSRTFLGSDGPVAASERCWCRVGSRCCFVCGTRGFALWPATWRRTRTSWRTATRTSA